MKRRVAEVVVRLGETIVTTAHVAAGASYRVGRTRDVDLALDVRTFALVASTADGFVVQRGPDDAAEPLADAIELAFGPVAITVAPVTLAVATLPRRPVDPRPFGFGVGSIAAHLGTLVLATQLAVPEPITVGGGDATARRPTKIARFAVEAQTTKPAPAPEPAEPPVTTDDTPADRPSVEDDAGAAAMPALPSPDEHGPTPVEPAPPAIESGGDGDPSTRRSFDPDSNPDFDTVKVGNFTTVASGAIAGDRFELAGANGNRKPLIVVSCDAQTCLILGGDPASGVREELQRRLPEIIACYRDHEASAGKKAEVDFRIDDAGKVLGVEVGGVGDYDSCVANIIHGITFESSGA